MQRDGVVAAEDISCVVIPDGCLGLPTMAALEQGISVIAVRENRNVMSNDLTSLLWTPGRLQIVEDHWVRLNVSFYPKTGPRFFWSYQIDDTPF